jgi:hypothetical protein
MLCPSCVHPNPALPGQSNFCNRQFSNQQDSGGSILLDSRTLSSLSPLQAIAHKRRGARIPLRPPGKRFRCLSSPHKGPAGLLPSESLSRMLEAGRCFKTKSQPEGDSRRVTRGEMKPGFWTEKQAAAFLGVQQRTLTMWRYFRRYPLAFVKMGERVYYPQAGVRAFARTYPVWWKKRTGPHGAAWWTEKQVAAVLGVPRGTLAGWRRAAFSSGRRVSGPRSRLGPEWPMVGRAPTTLPA